MVSDNHMKIENFKEPEIKYIKNRSDIYDTKTSKLVSLSNTLNYPISDEKIKEHNKYKELSDKFWEAFAKAYTKILLYIDHLAETKTRAEVTPEERQFFVDFQSMNELLGIDYQLPAFKESHEKQSIHTMADIYNHTDTLVQDPGAGFQEYINSGYGVFGTEDVLYNKDKLRDYDYLKLYPKWIDREQERQEKYPQWFDLKTGKIDINFIDQKARPIVQEKYDQAMKYGQNFLTDLQSKTQKIEKNYIMSFVLKEFSKLFMVSSTYDAVHFGYDFILISYTRLPTVR